MSRIDDLIAQHCPDGVEFKRLGEIARIRNGKDHKHLGDGDVPVYGSGGIMRYGDAHAFDRPSVLIPRKGSLGNLFYVDEPFWTVDTIFYTEIDESRVDPKFLYYFLTTVGLGKMNQAGGVPSQTQTVLNALKIPVPPLAIQREIASILDKMESLKAELEAELEYRSRQYEFYRDQLLAFDGVEGVRWVTMGEVGEFTRGRRFTKADVVENGIPCINFGEIYTRYGVFAHEVYSRVRAELRSSLRFARTGDVIVTGVSETVEDIAKAVAWLGEEDVAVHDDCFAYRHSLDPKFVSYYLQTGMFHAEKAKHVARAKVKRISSESLARLTIPVPSPEEQQRIVSILDQFDALVNDLSIGLPAEIAARQKQYEYYRDKLLTFPEREAS